LKSGWRKQRLAGVILDVTAEFDVLFVLRGFSSLTYLAEASGEIETCGKPVCIYHLGDHDEWGHDVGNHNERELRGRPASPGTTDPSKPDERSPDRGTKNLASLLGQTNR
jgi:hypothetical protein